MKITVMWMLLAITGNGGSIETIQTFDDLNNTGCMWTKDALQEINEFKGFKMFCAPVFKEVEPITNVKARDIKEGEIISIYGEPVKVKKIEKTSSNIYIVNGITTVSENSVTLLK